MHGWNCNAYANKFLESLIGLTRIVRPQFTLRFTSMDNFKLPVIQTYICSVGGNLLCFHIQPVQLWSFFTYSSSVFLSGGKTLSWNLVQTKQLGSIRDSFCFRTDSGGGCLWCESKLTNHRAMLV